MKDRVCQGVSIVMWAINKAMKLVDRVESCN